VKQTSDDARAGARVSDATTTTAQRGTLVCGDNLPAMRALHDGVCDLIYIDPPFKTERVRATRDGPQYDDRFGGIMRRYLDFLVPRLTQAHHLLSTKGSLYVHLDWRVAHYVRVELDRIFGPNNFLNEIIWSYRTGGLSKRRFARKHDTILLYAKSNGDHTFNVVRSGAFRTDGLNYDEHDRPYKNTKNGRLYFHPDGPALTDVWDIPFLSTVSNERTGYPSQKPEALLERIIRASSDPGDLVADFFCGSGTTCAVAARLHRRWLGCDSSEEAITIAARRLGVQSAPRAEASGSSEKL